MSGYRAPAERLFGTPGAERLDTSMQASIDRQWDWHVDAWRGATGGIGKPEPLAMTIEEWTVHPPEHHLPSADSIVSYITEMALDNETDEGWFEEAEDAASTPAVHVIAVALRLAIAQGIRYRMAADRVATWSVTRTVHWADGHSGEWRIEDSTPTEVHP